MHDQEPGIRRFTLTDSGKTFLETESKSREEINKHMQNLGYTWYGMHRQGGAAGEISKDFFRASRDLHHELRREHSKEDLDEAKTALEQVTKQIQEITRRLQSTP